MAFSTAWRNFKRMQDLTVAAASLIYAAAVVHAMVRFPASPALTLRWTSGAVFNHSRHVNAARVSVRIGAGMVSAPLAAALYGPAGRPVVFDQSVARQMEGMPAS